MPNNLYWYFTICIALLVGCSSSDLTSNEVTARGVRVARFSSNQPSIKAVQSLGLNPDLQVYEEQGYQEASDRLFQMDVLRRLSQAKLAALVGEKAYEKDTAMMAIGMPWTVAATTLRIKNEYPEAYEELEAFSRGVNQFLADLESKKPEVLRLYVHVTQDPNYRPEPWTPQDSIAVARNVSFYLSSAITEKIVMGTIALEILGDELKNPTFALFEKATQLSELFDFRPLENTLILQDKKQLFKMNGESEPAEKPYFNLPSFPVSQVSKLDHACIELGYPFPECSRKSGFGSNNFVVNAEFSGTGHAFLGNDTHLPLSFPSTMYEVALDATALGGSIQARGLNLPGVPGVLVGMNNRVAWGLTNLGADVDDIYLEKFDRKHPTTWRTDKGDRIARVTPFTIEVRKPFGQLEKRDLQVRWTDHGPVFSDHFLSLRDKIKGLDNEHDETALSYRWVGHEATLEYVAISRLNRSRNFTEFKSSLDFLDAGAQNFVYADTEGNIGYYAHGKFPVRKYFQGFFPRPYVPVFGQGGHEWSGYRKNVPEMYNPASGRIVTANNDPYGHSLNRTLSNFEDYFGVNFSSGCRAKRLTELLDEKKGQLDLQAVRAIQTDHKDLVAGHYLRLVREVVNEIGKDLSSEAREIADAMLAWEASGAFAKRQLQEPVKFRFFLEALIEEHFASIGLASFGVPLLSSGDENDPPVTIMDVLKENNVTLKTVYHHIHDELLNPSKRALAVKRVQTALENTLSKLALAQRKKKSWGQWNRLSFTNALEGILPPILNFPLERDGSFDTVDVSGEVGGRSLGPNFRMIVQLAPGEGITAYNVIPGGNWSTFDGQPLRDELIMWRDGKQRDMVPFL